MNTSTIIDRIRALLETTSPFDRLSDEERSEVLTDVSVEYFEPGEVVLAQGNSWAQGLYVVESGLVRLMDMENQRLLDKCSEGDAFGSFSLLKGGALTYEAKAVLPTVCALIKGERFQKLYDTNQGFASFYDGDLKRYVRRLGAEIDVAGAYRLFSLRLNQLALRSLVSCAPDTTVEEAARLMAHEGTDAILILDGTTILGLLTDSDLRNRVLAQGRALDTPVKDIMSSPVHTIAAEAHLFDAMMRLLTLRVHRLAVIALDDEGVPRPVAILTDRDVAHFRGQDPVATVRRVDKAPTLSELADIRSETNELMLRLFRQGVEPEQLIGILSIIYDRIVVRVLELVEAELREEKEPAGLSWAWVRLGSGGRQEMALSTKQHNALIYANPEDDAQAERAEAWFGELADRANTALERCGFAHSSLVAKDPYCRNSLRAWKKQYRTWIFESDAEELSHLSFLFFDLRAVYGDVELVDDLRRDVADALNIQAMDSGRSFLDMMTEHALAVSPPLSFMKRFELERSGEHRNTFDIRERGILPVADAARVLALDVRYLESTNTFDRLRNVAEEVPEMAALIDKVLEAYKYLFDFRLEHQLRAVEAGESPNNNIPPTALTKIQQNLLRDAFTPVDELQKALANRYNIARGRWL